MERKYLAVKTDEAEGRTDAITDWFTRPA